LLPDGFAVKKIFSKNFLHCIRCFKLPVKSPLFADKNSSGIFEKSEKHTRKNYYDAVVRPIKK